ncbi:MAG: ROK family protein, partial [Rhodobacteraceae bacterium]|nr:ROK family protein [Paracoccaceae bacterium]
GQPSVPMHLNSDGAYFLGLKVGRRSAELVLMDFMGVLRDRARVTYAYPTPDAALEFAEQNVSRLIDSLPPDARTRVAGLGIAMPFFLWDWAQTLQVPQEKMDAWRHVDLQAALAERVGVPVFLQNDASAACGAELVLGPENAPREFLYFYIGFFIGGGVVLNGAIYSGQGNSGALGPMPVADASGQIRPLIEVASLYTLERAVVASGASAGMIWDRAEHWNLPERILSDWIDTAAVGLAHAIVSSCSLIDFDHVRIDGWIPEDVKARLIAQVQEHLAQHSMTGLTRPDIEAGKIGADARALGAATLPLSEKYLIDS